MDRRLTAATLALALGAIPVPTHAINHTTDYKTNMDNYRVCTDPTLGSCDFDEVLSPSKFYLPNGTTTTVICKDDGTVQLRIDSGGILTDEGVSYGCGDRLFPCTGGFCVGGPHNGSACTVNRCMGGSNDGGVCSTDTACPGGGTCTGGASCVGQVCLDGPRENFSCNSPGDLACTNVANTSDWTVVFRGNRSSISYPPPYTQWHYHLYGDDDSGCMRVCSFSLGSTGAINSSGLSCTTTGSSCGVDSFHAVELRDPDGEIVAIPKAGAARTDVSGWPVEGDPAVVGDCSRPSNAAFCP
jgi:hypothetical protein